MKSAVKRWAYILVMPSFKPGDPAPEGYLQWHEWADVQHKAGLRQKQCGTCSKWCYPQELNPTPRVSNMRDSRGRPIKVPYFVCKKCAPTLTAEGQT